MANTWIGRAGAVVGVAALGAVVAFSGGVLSPERAAARPVVVAANETLACPSTGRGTTTTAAANLSGQVSLTDPADGRQLPAQPNGPVVTLKSDQPTMLSTTGGSIGGGTSVSIGTDGLDRGIAAAGCQSPTTEAWFPGVFSSDSRITSLVLTNVDPAQASVDLVFYGASGPIPAPGARSIVLRGNSTQSLSLETLVKSADPIAVAVRTTEGRVTVVARERVLGDAGAPANGVEWQAASPAPRTSMVIPGIPAGAGNRTLHVVNPGDRRAEVSVEFLGADGVFRPHMGGGVSVNPNSTTQLSLTADLAQGAAAVRLTSEQPVSASVISDNDGGDIAVQTTSQPFGGSVIVPVAAGADRTSTVVLSNPGTQPAEVEAVRLAADGRPEGQETVTIPAGATRSVQLPKADVSALRLRVAHGQVVAGLVITGDVGGLKGIATMPVVARPGVGGTIDPTQRPALG